TQSLMRAICAWPSKHWMRESPLVRTNDSQTGAIIGAVESLDGPSFSQECSGSASWLRLTLKPHRVAQGRALDDFIRLLIMSWKLHANAEVSATFHQQLRHGQPAIVELSHGMKNRRLTTDTGIVHS